MTNPKNVRVGGYSARIPLNDALCLCSTQSMVFDYDIQSGLRFVPKKCSVIDRDVCTAYCRSQTIITLYWTAFLAPKKS